MVHDLRVQRLQLRPSGGNAAVLKGRVANALRSARVYGAHLAPGTVLVVRRLTGLPPFPRRPVDIPRWQQALAGRLDALAARAPWPARQRVSPDAPAVRFADEVELLLCYTRDVLAGRDAWYWGELFPQTVIPTDQRLAEAWSTYAYALPATITALRPREVATAIARLTPFELSRLIRQLHETFALPAPARRTGEAADEAVEQEPAAASRRVAGSSPADGRRGAPAELGAVALAAPPWGDLLAPALRDLVPPRAAYLVGLCYSLVRQPRRARSERFGAAATAWLEGATARTVPPTPEPHLPDRAPSIELPPVDRWPTDPLPRAGDLQPGAVGPAAPAPTPSAGALPGAITRLGGAFYLINLLSLLRLCEDGAPLAGLNPWEALSALTAALLGDRFGDVRDDPLWTMLDDLSGLAPDTGCWGEALPAPPAQFLLPPGWLVPLRLTHLTARWADMALRRRRVWAEGPGLLAELAGAEASLGELASAYTAAGISLTLVPGPASGLPELAPAVQARLAPQLRWWLRRLLPFFRFLLAHALDDPGWCPERLLGQPARVAITRTHVDVLMPLASIDLRVRRAGLDRNPGWQPAFGRIITFYFERGAVW